MERHEVMVYQDGSPSCSHEWEYVREYDHVERRCQRCHRVEAMWEQESLDNDEWREHILPLVDPRA